jgi:dTDP-3,4-didehydro-2,6-dideoxy-alpha-D-glucose 3-reductase
MGTQKIRVGIMGCANIARRSLIPAFIAHPQFELVAIASRSLEKSNAFSKEFDCVGLVGYKQLLAQDIDAVYIPLPTGLHDEWVTKSLNAGKHIFVEKSFGKNLVSTQTMLNIAIDSKLVAMENFMFPFHSQHKALLKMVNEGEIGKIQLFRATFCFPPLDSANFRYQAEMGGGALLDAGAYTVKAVQEVLGSNLRLLSASMCFDQNKQIDISGSAQLLFDEKIPVQLAWGFDHFYQCEIQILGSLGKISTNRSFTANIGFEPSVVLETSSGKQAIQLPSDNHFQNILTEFARRISTSAYEESALEIKRQSTLLDSISKTATQHLAKL